MSKKRLSYRPVRKNETVDIVLALSQAVVLIDTAAELSLNAGDGNLMLEVADRWIAIGSMFAEDSGSEGNEVVNINDNVEQYGFSRSEVKPEEDD